MDHQNVQQQQKDFFNTLFVSGVGAETSVQPERGNELNHPSLYGGALPSPTEAIMPSTNPVIPNFPLNFDLITQLITAQGQQSASVGQGQFSSQLVIEQRLKLNQLHQLQLQHQILQQQVCSFHHCPHRPYFLIFIFCQLELLNGQGNASSMDGTPDCQKSQNPNPFLGLPTPGGFTL
jgi:hypothetical protein